MLDNDFEAYTYEQSKVHRTGRPTKLNENLIEEICDLIAEGYTFAEAARIRRVGESTFFRWMSTGKREDSEPIYKNLVARVHEVAEFSEIEAIQTIRSSAIKKNNCKGAMWLLERRFPEKYGRNQRATKDNDEQTIQS